MTEKKAAIIVFIIIAALLLHAVSNRSDSVSGSSDQGTDFWSDY